MCARQRSRSRGESDAEHELQRLLVDVIRSLRRSGPPPPDLRRAFRAAGLGPRHVHTLAHLAKGEPMTVSQLAHRLRVTLPTASLLVAELGRAGLVDRRSDETDRRRTIVTVAERYRDAIDEWLASRSEPLRRALAKLDPGEQATLLKALRLIDEELRPGDRC
jgi:DNA-binding MarR family transcriptional regulator